MGNPGRPKSDPPQNSRMKINKSVLPILLGALVLSACGGPWTMGKSELQTWYRDDLSRYSGSGKLGYRGSDFVYHYFIARPVDNFIVIQVPRGELALKDELGTSELDRERLYFYLVDPERNFRKLDGVAL